MHTKSWYRELKKPSWAPPSSVFGPVWSFLYCLIAVSYGYAAYLFFTHHIGFSILLPFILNIVLNALYTPIQFGLKNNWLALLDILLVDATLVWALIVIFPFVHWVSYINLPYLLWASFATILQIAVTLLNSSELSCSLQE